MKEMVDSLTDHKLTATQKISDLERHGDALKEKLRDYEQLSIENEAMKRQIVRLTEENDEQAVDLKNLDDKLEQVNRMSQQQNQELILLERSVNKWKEMEINYKRLQEEHENLKVQCQNEREAAEELEGLRSENKECKNSHNQMTLLHQKTMDDFEKVSREMMALQQQLASVGENVSSESEDLLRQENDTLKNEINKKNNELGNYKVKIGELGTRAADLKKYKDILLQTSIEHKNAITECRKEVVNCTDKLLQQIAYLEQNNVSLVAKLKASDDAVVNLKRSHFEAIDILQALNRSTEKRSEEIRTKYESQARSNQELEAQIEYLQKNKQNEEVLHQLTAENHLSKEELESLAKTNEGLSSENVRLLEQIQIDNAKAKEMAAKIDVLQTENENLAREQELSAEGQSFKEEIHSLNNKIELISSENARLSKEVEGEIVKTAQLSSNIADLKNQNEKLLQDFEASKQSKCTNCESYVDQLKDSESKVNNLQVTIDDLSKSLKKDKEIYIDLQIKCEELSKKNLEDSAASREINEALKNRNTSLLQELDILKKTEIDLQEARKELALKNEAITAVETKCQELVNKNKDWQQEFDNLKKSECLACQELKNHIETGKMEMEKLQNSIKDVQTSHDIELNAGKEEINKIKEVNEGMKNRILSLSQELEITKHTDRQDCEKFQKTIEEKTVEFQQILAELSDCRNDLEKKVHENKVLQDQHKELAAKCEKLNAKFRDIEETNGSERKAVTQQMKQLQSDIGSIQSVSASLESELKAKSDLAEDLKNERDLLAKRIEDVEMEKHVFEKKLNALSSEISALRENQDSTQEIQSQIDKYQSKMEALERDLEAKNQEIITANENVVQMSKKNEEIVKEVESLRQTECQQCLDHKEKEANCDLELTKLRDSLTESNVELQKKIQRTTELEKYEEQMKQKNDELLVEMREINEALKNRGDVISKQNKEISDLQGSLEQSANRLRELEGEVKEKMAAVEKLTSSVRDYENRPNDSLGKIFFETNTLRVYSIFFK